MQPGKPQAVLLRETTGALFARKGSMSTQAHQLSLLVKSEIAALTGTYAPCTRALEHSAWIAEQRLADTERTTTQPLLFALTACATVLYAYSK